MTTQTDPIATDDKPKSAAEIIAKASTAIVEHLDALARVLKAVAADLANIEANEPKPGESGEPDSNTNPAAP